MKVTVPMRVTTSSMLWAKLSNAIRPSRLIALIMAAFAMGIGVSRVWNMDLTSSVVGVFGGIVALRLFVMGASSLVDRGAHRFNGTLTATEAGLELAHEAQVEARPWTWVLEVSERPQGFVVRLDERGGRVWVFLGREQLDDVAYDALRALFVRAGKLI